MCNRFQHNISCTEPILVAESQGHATHAFVNNIYIGNKITCINNSIISYFQFRNRKYDMITVIISGRPYRRISIYIM